MRQRTDVSKAYRNAHSAVLFVMWMPATASKAPQARGRRPPLRDAAAGSPEGAGPVEVGPTGPYSAVRLVSLQAARAPRNLKPGREEETMRDMLLTTTILAAMAFGATAASAQSSGQSGTAGSASTSSQSTQASSGAMPKAMSQDKVRQVMKDAGFTNVRILDATYLVQASTKDGDQILVVLNPPAIGIGTPAAPSSTGGSSGTSGSTTSGSSSATPPKQ